MKIYNYWITEGEFGASTSCQIGVDRNNVVKQIKDTSTHKTNYAWDGWNNNLESYIGKDWNEVDNDILSTLEDFEDEYRNPTVHRSKNIEILPSAILHYADCAEEDGLKIFADELRNYTEKNHTIKWNDSGEFIITNIKVQEGFTKILYGEMNFSKVTSQKTKLINQFKISDKIMEKSIPLDTNGIDINSLSGGQIKLLLNGNKIDHFDSAGNFLGKLGLSKTPTGWGLSIGKQVVSIADNEAGI